MNRDPGLGGRVKHPKKVGQVSLSGCVGVIFGSTDVTLWVVPSDREREPGCGEVNVRVQESNGMDGSVGNV